MKTIGRNRKALIDRIFAVGTDGRSFNLENYFSGKPVSMEWIRREFEMFNFARLRNKGDGAYEVHVHGNQWYEFTAPDAEPIA